MSVTAVAVSSMVPCLRQSRHLGWLISGRAARAAMPLLPGRRDDGNAAHDKGRSRRTRCQYPGVAESTALRSGHARGRGLLATVDRRGEWGIEEAANRSGHSRSISLLSAPLLNQEVVLKSKLILHISADATRQI